jgi:23S rRNA pseudouridine2605 synthase
VNGEKILVPQTMVNPHVDKITVEGKRVSVDEKLYFILNKPRGYVCSAKDEGRGKLVLKLFKGVGARLFTVGRLDRDTTGLIVVTNDGHFANRVIHPSFGINKEYVVKSQQEIMHEHLVAISNGTMVEGTFVKPVSVKKMRKGTVKIVVSEGKKREVRLLMQNAGLKVKELKRTRIGNLQLGGLGLGSFREMTQAEKDLF